MRTGVLVVGVAVVWASSACGPSTSSYEPLGAAGTAGGGSGGLAGAGLGGTGAAAGTATGGTAGAPTTGGAGTSGTSTTGGGTSATSSGPYGTVQFGRILRANAATSFEASARFYAQNSRTGYDCSTETFGDCRLSTCVENDTAPAPSYAGTITLSDGNAIDLTLMGAKGEVYSAGGASITLSGGEVVTVTASGDEVPAFMATVAVPKVITISAPVLDAMGSASVRRDADLVLTFDNRSADGESGTTLLVQSTSSDGRSLSCALPTASGTATIPSAALSRLDSGTPLLLITTRIQRVQAGDFDVSVIGYFSATNPEKSAGASLKLE